MDALTNYPEFSQDIMASFEELIREYSFDFYKVYDGCYEIKNVKSIFRFTYDRGEISCNIKNPISNNNEFGYGVYSVFRYLFPNNIFEIENKPTYNPRLQLFEYSRIIKKYFVNIINGDFSWLNGYLVEQKHFSNQIKFIREKLEYDNPIKQKFLNGDISWQKDIDNYLKAHGFKL